MDTEERPGMLIDSFKRRAISNKRGVVVVKKDYNIVIEDRPSKSTV
jgi:hypothetical protein